MSRLNSTNEEFNKIKDGLINDIKIIQTEQANSQKKIKLAEEIVQKTKTEYKKLNDEYIKLENYKNKCEKYIQHLQGENSNLTQRLSSLQKKLQNNNNNKYTRSNYYQLQNKNSEEFESEEEEKEEEEEEQGYENELEQEEDITENETHPLITKNKPNKPPPKKKIKKGISNFI